jgi:hypothetical protein
MRKLSENGRRGGRIAIPGSAVKCEVGDKVVVFQYDGKGLRGGVVVTEVHKCGNKVHVLFPTASTVLALAAIYSTITRL